MARPRQLSLLEGPMALADLSPDPGADYGEVFTRRWVVDLILDLAGYTSDKDLAAQRIVEPSCGTGAFLVPIVDRLVESCQTHGCDLAALEGAISAFDLLEANASRARKAVAQRLEEGGLDEAGAARLADAWVASGDFLLADHEPASADYVVGNPPYIRLENVRPEVMAAYRRRCHTMRGRSDIYVGFIELGLDLLKPGGALGFICADRWMRNQYGADLRQFVTESFAVDMVLAMHDVDAFEDDVSAYPAVIVLRNEAQGRAVAAEAGRTFDERSARRLSRWVSGSRRRTLTVPEVEASRLDRWFDGRDLWPVGSPTQLALVAGLEAQFPPLEDPMTGTRVGIGVATGCDELYLTRDADLVEEDRLLPLVEAGDTTTGVVEWSGSYLVNPWSDDGLVDLDGYPRLAAYLEGHGRRLRRRHVAKKRPEAWYRTIDRVNPSLLSRPKLLLPDMKSASHPVLDDGRYYPHHNLYFVTSDEWDLEVLGALLLSDVANLFVGAYCVKMRGGTYRFQAQYLRRIRVPEPAGIPAATARRLAAAFRQRDRGTATALAAEVYGIDLSLVDRH